MRVLIFLLLGFYNLLGHTEEVSEYAVKAGYIYNFALFTEWPPEALQENFNICLLGRDNFGSQINQLESKSIRGLPIKIARISGTRLAHKCQIMYIAESEAHRASFILRELSDLPVLTISDTADITGTMLSMRLEGKRIVFDANHQRSKFAHLKLSSKLLQLAKNVQ